MTMDRIRATMMKALSRLDRSHRRRRADPPHAGRDRHTGKPVPDAAAALPKPGFAEEAMPWIDAVHRFALRLTRNAADAEDLVQETFLRAYRAWDQYEAGTNCRSWLFTICRNTHMHERELARSRYEVADTDVATADNRGSVVQRRAVSGDSPADFFAGIIDERLLDAVDGLADEFREPLILSDLADLNYAEIAEVLDIPVGTVKSRLFRARRQVRDALLAHGMGSAYADGRTGPDRGTT
jgi:RNA polymerase sigma-70 factor, ECF subfamily